MFAGLWWVFTKPAFVTKKRWEKWAGGAVAVLDVFAMLYLCLWGWYALGIPWATKALYRIKGLNQSEAVSWYLTCDKEKFFHDERLFRCLEQVDPNWEKQPDASRVVAGLLEGEISPEKVYTPKVLAELKRAQGEDFALKLLAKFPGDWRQLGEAKAGASRIAARLPEYTAENAKRSIALLEQLGARADGAIGPFLEQVVDGDVRVSDQAKSLLDRICKDWARSDEARNKKAWLEERENSHFYFVRNRERQNAEWVLLQMDAGWSAVHHEPRVVLSETKTPARPQNLGAVVGSKFVQVTVAILSAISGLVINLIFAIPAALIASKKGFKPRRWLITLGWIGLIVAWLKTSAKVSGISSETAAVRAASGDRIGAILACINLGIAGLPSIIHIISSL
jgi:hypothetical protein